MDQNPDVVFVSRQLSREALKRSGALQLRVTSASMIPLLEPDDKILVQPVNPQDLLAGQIVVYERGGDWITHRLIQCRQPFWVIKGDAHLAPDAPVDSHEVIGGVMARLRTMKTGNINKINLNQRRWLWLGSYISLMGRLQIALWEIGNPGTMYTPSSFGILKMKLAKGLCRLTHRVNLAVERIFILLFS